MLIVRDITDYCKYFSFCFVSRFYIAFHLPITLIWF